MIEAARLHREAMELAEEATLERLRGNTGMSIALLRRALEKEQAAAALVESALEFEPTRSVLHRSAASLAIECGELSEAERLIAAALSGAPPADIAEELRQLRRSAASVTTSGQEPLNVSGSVAPAAAT